MIKDNYEGFIKTPVDYRILRSLPELLDEAYIDPRHWRIVELGHAAVDMLRVPLQIDNATMREIEHRTDMRVASREEMAAAFRSGPDHQFLYPWGNDPGGRDAPFLLRANPHGMGMNCAGLYFNGPDNRDDPRKNGLWMVVAQRDENGHFISGDRAGAAGNVAVFPPVRRDADGLFVSTGAGGDLVTLSGKISGAPGDRGVLPGHRGALSGDRGALPGHRGALPGDRGILPGDRGMLPGQRGVLTMASEVNRLTPAGIGENRELCRNEGYLVIRSLDERQAAWYRAVKEVLGNKLEADDGIAGLSIGTLPNDPASPVIVFGAFGHCLSCPNPLSLTIPINAPEIAAATGVPVIPYPEFAQHQVPGRQAIRPHGAAGIAEPRIYYP